MLLILSPSKSQDFVTKSPIDNFSQPQYRSEIQHLIASLKNKSIAEIKSLMSISDKLAELNYDRFQKFASEFNYQENAKQAVFSFTGDVYDGLNAENFNEADLNFANQHLRIISGLYGLLKPSDLIQPYRLEMKTKLNNNKGEDLYQFWQETLTAEIKKLLAKEKYLINLASNEYSSAIKFKELEAPVINITFKENKNGNIKIIAIYAKKARGLMANYIIKNKLTELGDLKKFDIDNYKFAADLSDEKNFTYVRKH